MDAPADRHATRRRPGSGRACCARAWRRSEGSYESSGLPLDGSLRDLPPMRSVELMAFAAPRIATALGQLAARAGGRGLADRRRRAPLHDRARGPAGAGRGGRDGGDHGAVRRRAGGRDQAGRRGVARRRRGQYPAVAAVGPVVAVVGGRGHRGAGAARPAPAARTSRCCWRTIHVASFERARTLLDDALETVQSTGEQFCQAEILRVRAGVPAALAPGRGRRPGLRGGGRVARRRVHACWSCGR